MISQAGWTVWYLKHFRVMLIDIITFITIYFLPAFSHLLSFPLYQLDPMRLAIVFSLVHTRRKNTYFLALSLPLFSFLISSHPSLVKVVLISSELFLNVYLFYFIKDRIGANFVTMLISVLFSKMFYYSMKLFFIDINLINGQLITTPVYLQISMIFAFSIYIYSSFAHLKL